MRSSPSLSSSGMRRELRSSSTLRPAAASMAELSSSDVARARLARRGDESACGPTAGRGAPSDARGRGENGGGSHCAADSLGDRLAPRRGLARRTLPSARRAGARWGCVGAHFGDPSRGRLPAGQLGHAIAESPADAEPRAPALPPPAPRRAPERGSARSGGCARHSRLAASRGGPRAARPSRSPFLKQPAGGGRSSGDSRLPRLCRPGWSLRRGEYLRWRRNIYCTRGKERRGGEWQRAHAGSMAGSLAR